jgi:hypothetical protein
MSWNLQYPSVLAPDSPWARAGDVDRDGKPELVASFEDPYGDGIQLAAYTLTDFEPGGTLRSSVLDGGAEPSWGRILWNADVPAGTSLDIEVRASNDPGSLGAWLTVPANGTELGTLLDPSLRYIQYRTSMETSDNGVSPVLREIELEGGMTTAVLEGQVPNATLAMGLAAPNPMRGGTTVSYTLGQPAHVRAAIYDAAGREVVRVDDTLRDAGSHEVTWDGTDTRGNATAAGTYFLWLRAGGEEEAQRIIRVR